MSKKTPPVKIRLKAGDKPGVLLDYLLEKSNQAVCLVLERDFTVVTESHFIQRFKAVLQERTADVYFVTQKPYFQKVLSDQHLKVQGYEPDEFADVTLQTLGEALGNVAAQKNAFEKKAIDFKPKLQTGESRKPQFSMRKIENLSRERSLRGVYFFVFLLLIGALIWLYFWISPQAEITVKPRINTTEVTQNIVIGLPDAQWDSRDENLPKVSGIEVQTEQVQSQTFASTGRNYQLTNARGEVTLFNDTAEPKFLVPSRLQSEDGVIVRMQGEVTIPPRNADGPGQAVVTVMADEYDEAGKPIGSRGNLEAGTNLFFPALRSELQALYYAKANRGPLVGGSTLTQYFVKPEDSELAKPLFEESLRIQAIDSLKAELDGRSRRENKDYILVEQSSVLRSTLENFSYDEVQTGQPLQAFTLGGQVKLNGLVFDQDEVIEIMAQKLRESQDDRKKMVNIDRGSVEYRILETEFYDTQQWIKLSVTLTGVETLDFEANNQFAREWQQSVKKEVLGRSVESARALLLNHPEIEEIVNLEIRPFWLQKLPAIMDQIQLKIRY